VRTALALVAVLALAGCGGGNDTQLTVSAASSLKQALPEYQPDNRYSFAGSDQLAAQIRAGAKPDVFAAANTKLPDDLYKAGLVEKPKVFATNTLVMAVPAGTSRIDALGDLEQPGVKIAMAAPDVPAGSYARQVLGRLDPRLQKAILANVRSNEPDVAGVVGKVSQHAVDAGFVYVTDVKASGGRLKAIELPPPLEPNVAYAAAVVKGTKHASEARDFVDGLAGAGALRTAGFGPPPAG
jgi:molybdate transport system substrate-binding protein